MVPVKLPGKLTGLAVMVSLTLSASFGSVDALPFDDRDVIYFLSEEPEITSPEDDLDTPVPQRPTRAPSFSLCSEDGRECAQCRASIRQHNPENIDHGDSICFVKKKRDCCRRCNNGTWSDIKCAKRPAAESQKPATREGDTNQVHEADEAKFNEEEKELLFLSQF